MTEKLAELFDEQTPPDAAPTTPPRAATRH